MLNLSIISAEEKRKEVEMLKIKREAERIAYEALRNQRVEQLVERLFKMVKNDIEKSEENKCETVITETIFKSFESQDWGEFEDAATIVKTLLEKAGYTFYEHTYSDSWRKKSGKIVSFSISWKKF